MDMLKSQGLLRDRITCNKNKVPILISAMIACALDQRSSENENKNSKIVGYKHISP